MSEGDDNKKNSIISNICFDSAGFGSKNQHEKMQQRKIKSLITMIEGCNKMGGKPKISYTDDDGDLQKEAKREYLDKEGIEHHRTRALANFSERAIRTFKDMLYNRVEADEKKVKQIFNGQTIYMKYYLHIIIKWNIQQLR